MFEVIEKMYIKIDTVPIKALSTTYRGVFHVGLFLWFLNNLLYITSEVLFLALIFILVRATQVSL